MEIFNDSEVVFMDAYAPKPTRTLVVNTNAPLHSVNSNVSPSSGVSVFNADSAYSDRFIVWRAIGQKLFLEERSACRTVLRGSLCLEFSRSPILPGTSISLLENSVLSIVVPTQSSVHRFYVRLVPDPSDLLLPEIPSIFEQIVEKEFLVDYHTSYLLTTVGQALRASVMEQRGVTKIAYCMAEGQLVVVSMTAFRGDCDEVVYRDGNLITRIISGSASEGVCDVCSIQNDTKHNNTFYAVYRDGIVRAWNIESQKSHCFDIGRIESTSLIKSGCSWAIRAYRLEKITVVVVAVYTETFTRVHFLRDHHGKLTDFFSLHPQSVGNLLDIAVSHRSGATPRLWLLWNSPSVVSDYVLKFADTPITDRTIESCWSPFRTVYPLSLNSELSTDMSTADLRDFIFNADNRPFDVVFRAVQISCDSGSCEIAHGDWKGLSDHIAMYLRTPEFDMKYMDRARTMRTPAKESRASAESRFYFHLASACEQLEQAARGPLGIFLVDIPGACLGGVIQQDRFSLVHDRHADMAAALESKDEQLLLDTLLDAKRRKMVVEPLSSDSDEETVSRQPTGKVLGIPSLVSAHWLEIIHAFIDTCNTDDVSVETGKSKAKPPFGGQFTAGLIAACLRKTLMLRLSFSRNMLILLDTFDRWSWNCDVLRKGRLHELRLKLDLIKSCYSQMLTQLDMKLSRNGALMSLGSWFMAENGFALLHNSYSYEPCEEEVAVVPEYNLFVEQTVQASMKTLLPSAQSVVIYHFLAQHEQYPTLKKLCTHNLVSRSELTQVLTFYRGIAYSGLGQPQKAMTAFNEAAATIETGKAIPALARAVRSNKLSDEPLSLGEYYTEAIRYLDEHGHSEEVVEMAQNVLHLLPTGDESSSRIHATLFNHLVSEGKWTEALVTIKHNKDLDMRRVTLLELISRLLQGNEWKTIAELAYGDLEDQVEEKILHEARAQDICVSPHLFEACFAFYMYKSDFVKAAEVMYEQAVLLKQVTQTPGLLKRRRDCLVTASNLLDLAPTGERFMWFPHERTTESDAAVVPDTTSSMDDSDPAPRPSSSSPVQWTNRRKFNILEAEQVATEWAVANARVVLLATKDSTVPPIEPAEIVNSLIEVKHFDLAFDICRQCDVPVFGVLRAVAQESCMLDAQQPPIAPEWVNLNRRYTDGAEVCDNWAVARGLLRTCVSDHPTDSRPLRAVVTTILSHAMNVPCWLKSDYLNQDLPDFVRCLIEFDALAPAVAVLSDDIQKETDKVRSVDCHTMLPYSVIDATLQICRERGEDKLMSRLNESLRFYVSRINSFETAARFAV